VYIIIIIINDHRDGPTSSPVCHGLYTVPQHLINYSMYYKPEVTSF